MAHLGKARALLVLSAAASAAGEAFTGRSFRVVAKDLEDGGAYPQLAGQWKLYSLRFFSAESCAPQSALQGETIAAAQLTVSKTYVATDSPLADCNGPFGVACTKPRDPLSEGATPAVAIRWWIGVPQPGLEADGVWIQLDFPGDTTIGCVKLFQDPLQTAASLAVQVPGPGGEFVTVMSAPGRACPVDAPTACCACGDGQSSGCDWDCPAVTTMQTASHPSPSPPPQPPFAPDDGAGALSSGLDSTDWPLLILIIVFACLTLLLCCIGILYARYRGWICVPVDTDDENSPSYRAQLFVIGSGGKRGGSQPISSINYDADDEHRESLQSGALGRLTTTSAPFSAPNSPKGEYPPGSAARGSSSERPAPMIEEEPMMVQVREAKLKGGETINLVQVGGPLTSAEPKAVAPLAESYKGTAMSPEGVMLQVRAAEVQGAGMVNLIQLADPQPSAASSSSASNAALPAALPAAPSSLETTPVVAPPSPELAPATAPLFAPPSGKPSLAAPEDMALNVRETYVEGGGTIKLIERV